MRVLTLTLKDLSQLIKDWKTFAFLLVMPIAFTLLFGFVFGANSGEADSRLALGFINQDDSPITDQLVAVLEKSGVFKLVSMEEANFEEMRQQVADGELIGALLIPAGYGEAMMSGKLIRVELVLEQDSTAGINIKEDLLAPIARLHSMVLAARLSTEDANKRQPFKNVGEQQAFFYSALENATMAWQNPDVKVKNTWTGQEIQNEEAVEVDNGYAHSSPGMMIQFAIAGLVGAAEILVAERTSRSLQRLLTTAVSRFEILLGHYLAMFSMILIQITVLMFFGQLFLDLNYIQHPLASLLIAVTLAMTVAALGLLVGALAKTAENAVVFSLIPMFVFSGLGGAWLPLEFTSENVQFIGHFTPVAWGMDGLKNILLRGMGLEGVWLPALALIGFAVLFFSLAVWLFKFE
jgi:ABC-2 type transport system permease protein